MSEEDKDFRSAIRTILSGSGEKEDIRAHIRAVGGYYNDPLFHQICKGVRDGSEKSCRQMAEFLQDIIPQRAYIVPMPSHKGTATTMLKVCEHLTALRPDLWLANDLQSNVHAPIYDSKATGKELPEISMKLRDGSQLTDSPDVFIVDNVIATGRTASAALRVLPQATVVALSNDTTAPKVWDAENSENARKTPIHSNSKMKTQDDSFQRYLSHINIQEVLKAAGYSFNRKDGIRYPSYQRKDDNGHFIHGDKFFLTRNGQCCWRGGEDKRYNVISFITSFPELFIGYSAGSNVYDLVHKVCRGILGEDDSVRAASIVSQPTERAAFDYDSYSHKIFDIDSRDSIRQFYPYFAPRGLNTYTMKAFSASYTLASREYVDDKTGETKTITNLAFPLRIPADSAKIVGLEERGRRRADGTSYKGMARNSNSSEGLWIASPGDRKLEDARDIYWFESAYDAMAFYQLNSRNAGVRDAVFLSTGGNPSVMQQRGVLDVAPNATHHLCFDSDTAGLNFVNNFFKVAGVSLPSSNPQKFQSSDVLIRPDLIPYLKSLGNRSNITDAVRNIFTSRGRRNEYRYVLSGDSNLLPEDFRQMDNEELRDALVDYHDIYNGCKAYAATLQGDWRTAPSVSGLLSGDDSLLPQPMAEIREDILNHTKKISEMSVVDPDSPDVRHETEMMREEFTRFNDVLSAWTSGSLDERPAYKIVRDAPQQGYKDWNENLLAELEKKNQKEHDVSKQTSITTAVKEHDEEEQETRRSGLCR